MPRGGARIGAGRPKKPLADKVLEGNPGKRELTKLQFQDEGDYSKNIHTNSKSIQNNSKNNQRAFKKPPSYLDIVAKESQRDVSDGDVLPSASEIYKLLAEFIEGTGCAKFIAPILIEDFAFLRRAYLECEFVNRRLGRIIDRKRSPYIGMALDYQKAMMAMYDKIWLIISQNCDEPYGEKNAFLELLKNRGF